MVPKHVNHGKTKLNRKRTELETAKHDGDITPDEYDAITDFEEYDLANNKPRTVAGHLLYLRTTAERADTSLLDMTADDVNTLLRSFKDGTHDDVKDEGIIVKNYVSALRKFYRYHDDLPADDRLIEVDETYSGRSLDPDDLLYQEEIDDYLAAAQRESPRDLAAIAITLAVGMRIDAVRTLRLRHIKTDGPTMEITLNQEEGDLKGATGARALLWAKHFVRPWYENHPHNGNDDAALFPAEIAGNNWRDGNKYSTEPMSDRAFREIFKKRAQDAGIEKDVYPHLLRHSAITRMAANGRLNEQQIKGIVGWSRDTSQFDTYVTLADEIQTDSVRKAMGIPTSQTGPPVVGRPSLTRCPECSDQLPEDTERCPTCQTPLTHGEAEASGTAADRGGPTPDPEDMVDDMDEEEMLAVVNQIQEKLSGD